MSFDLALNKGDLDIGSDGDLRKVRNTEKVIQDVLKVLHTPLGSNPYFPRIGNSLTAANIGEGLNEQFAQTKVEASVNQAVQIVQNVQRNQELRQSLTPEEKITQIAEVSASLDMNEPRQYNISVIALTGALSSAVTITTKLTFGTVVGDEAV